MNDPTDAPPPGEEPTRREPAGPDWPPLALMVAHMRRRWLRGERALAESYLAGPHAPGDGDEVALDLIYNEILLREAAGESPSLEDYRGRFPGLIEPIRMMFEVEGALRPETLFGSTERPDGAGTLEAGGAASRPFAGYEILGVLGRGGMGVVYKARQLALNRTVALKMILAGEHASPESALRFLAEAEVAAGLQHPNIVQVYHLGKHDGRPCIEMEYVPGGSLAQAHDGTPWPPRRAAQLVATLARAIHEAHRRGVVHRDLKPSNVLLAADGTPKIADFGLAKCLGQGPGLTRTDSVLGSPGYMAPEQAGGRSRQIGPAADVYALGAILYDLLAGRPPFRAATALETLEQVRSAEPVPPSRFVPGLPRDVETIALKCLEKEPSRRYATAEDLAEDLRRFAAGEPIRARPVGHAERLGRWCLREPRVAGLAAGLVAALLAGFALVTWQWHRAERQADAARAERNKAVGEWARAERNFQRARQVVGRLMRLGRDLAEMPRTDRTSRALLEESLTVYLTLLGEKTADPGVRLEAALSCMAVGHFRHVLHRHGEADEAFLQGAALLERLAAEFPDEPSYRFRLAECCRERGNLLRDLGEDARSLEAYDRAVDLGERLLAGSSGGARHRSSLASTLINRCVVLKARGRLDVAEADYRRAIALQEEALAAAPGKAIYRTELALGLDDLGILLWSLGRREEAETSCRRALELRRGVAEGDDHRAWNRSFLARSYLHIGQILAGTARPEQAEASYRQAIRLQERLAAEFPDTPNHRSELNGTLGALADLLDGVPGRRPEAEAVREQILDHSRTLAADFPEEVGLRQGLALQLYAAGRTSEAVEELGRVLAEKPGDRTSGNALAWILATAPEPGCRDPQRALALAEEAVRANGEDAACWNTLGVARYRNGDHRGAVAGLRRSMQLGSGGTPHDWLFLAMAHWQLGEPALGTPWYDKAVQAIESSPSPDRELLRFREEADSLRPSE
jgi:tetratricopeptide (TPR) repeat protein/tRNA A-37 threonylcarbamoyl transferase component Bud32